MGLACRVERTMLGPRAWSRTLQRMRPPVGGNPSQPGVHANNGPIGLSQVRG